MYSIVVEVVYCAGNNASLLRLLLMNTATSTALHCADLSHYTALFKNFAVVVVDKVVASFRFGRCCICVSVHSVWSYKKWRRKVILLSIHYYVVLKCRSLEY